jgi:DNA polymerase-3 subunit alpha
MLLSQKLAGFTKGKADELRKAMGKKDRAKLDSLKPMFMEGCASNQLDTKVCEKIWVDWEKFASYAFNKSHSTCYAFVAFQTAYLKAHYPAEYMASVLSHNMSDIKQINFFLSECRRMQVPTLGPDINESDVRFSVNKAGEIRFALSAIKGVGEAAVTDILIEREKSGPFKNIFDLTKRVNSRSVNKKNIESHWHKPVRLIVFQIHIVHNIFINTKTIPLSLN